MNLRRHIMTNHSGQTLAYKRVSSFEQNLARQEYLEDGADKVFTDKVSSVKERPQLERLLAYAREGDLIRVHSIDRFARSVKDLKIMIDDLLAKGVSVEFVSESLTFTPDTANNLYADVLLSVLGSIYEFERKMMLIRQAEGIAKAKVDGKYKGRQRILTDTQVTEIQERIDLGVPVARIARIYKVSRATIYAELKRLEDAS